MATNMRIQRSLHSLLSGAPLLYLTASTVTSLHRVRGQPWTAAFVASAYVNLLLLFGCLWTFDRVPEEDLQKRARLKIAILCLATILNASFCHQVTKLMPHAIAVILWCLVAVVATAGAFWMFFVHESHRQPHLRDEAHVEY